MSKETQRIAKLVTALDDREAAITAIVGSDELPDDPACREFVYRLWCRYHRASVLRSELERVRAARRRDTQESLF